MENYYFDIIKNIIDQNKLSQVYLLSSSPNLDLNKYIVYFINKINNENFDSLKSIKFGELYFLVEGNKKNSIKKDELAEACKDVIESSLTSNKKYKILILKNIENSSISSLNAMLKFLEEPPKNTIILMTTNNKNKVLKTIKSRAFEIKITNKSITKIDNKCLEFFCQISDNEEFLKQINQDENVKLLDSLKKNILKANDDFTDLSLFLYESLNDENYLFLIKFLVHIYKELYLSNVNIGYSSRFLNAKELKIYNVTFPFLKIIYVAEQFLKDAANTSFNFKLQKAAFIVKLEEYYE